MLGRLDTGPLTVGELAEPLAMSLWAASKHIKVLERAGLVQRTVAGRRHLCRLQPEPLASASAWLRFYERHWEERLDALEGLFRTHPRQGGSMTYMTAEQAAVRLHRTIPAPPERVYRAWLEPDLLRRWLAPGSFEVTRVEVDERVGGRYRIWHASADGDVGGFECELLELVPSQRIVFRWGFVGPERAAGPAYDSLLTITLAEAPGGATALTLVHERLDALHAAMPEVAEDVGPGWAMVLDKLAEAIEEVA
jgi:uncharacterized protein YndB with AHSA1/START domain/DNA-binding transcriptional ArsR family regulator